MWEVRALIKKFRFWAFELLSIAVCVFGVWLLVLWWCNGLEMAFVGGLLFFLIGVLTGVNLVTLLINVIDRIYSRKS